MGTKSRFSESVAPASRRLAAKSSMPSMPSPCAACSARRHSTAALPSVRRSRYVPSGSCCTYCNASCSCESAAAGCVQHALANHWPAKRALWRTYPEARAGRLRVALHARQVFAVRCQERRICNAHTPHDQVGAGAQHESGPPAFTLLGCHLLRSATRDGVQRGSAARGAQRCRTSQPSCGAYSSLTRTTVLHAGAPGVMSCCSACSRQRISNVSCPKRQRRY
jgi:hypothetical protein